MAKQTTKKVKEHSMYEDALIYMSYRYAIGRHTIHSHCHACDILSNEYERFKVSPERMAFVSKDMDREIENNLRYGKFSVYNYTQENKHILDVLISHLIDDNGNIKYDMSKVKNIKLVIDYDSIDFNVEYQDEINTINPIHDLSDLMIWNNVSKMLDTRLYRKCKLINDEIVEYVDIYDEDRDENNNLIYRLLHVPVEKYVKNPHVMTYIPEENIKEYIS